MKAKYISILTAIAAVATLASCNKDLNPGKVDTDQPAETLRTITVSFDTPTKSYLYEMGDGILQPLFNEGDSILVSNGIKLDTCRVFPKKSGVVSFRQPMAILTKLEGPLTAVYPYTAALCEGNTITGIKVPSEQSGSFADANICMANQEESVLKSDEVLAFETKVAILRFYTKGIEVDSIRITSSVNPIAYDEGKQITLAPKQPEVDTEAVAQQEMGHQVLTIEPDYWYAAIDVEQGGVAGRNLIFESVTKTQDTTVVKQSTSEAALGANTMYNVFIPYYIKVQVGYDEEKGEPIIQRWGYCDIGAFKPGETGEFFMWGEVKGHRMEEDAGSGKEFYADFASFDFSDGTRYIKPDRTNGFSYVNTPYYAGSTAEKYTEDDKLTQLETIDDAATANWGEGWRLPTEEEFTAFFTRNEDYLIPGWFAFGCTGNGQGLELDYPLTYYWTNSISSSDVNMARALYTASPSHNCIDLERYIGCPIRPIYEKPSSEETFGVTITQYTNGGTL